ncbi:MAG TPA: NUDIX domain-containing protein [Puia sp.]|nr:NUDIX domain-containing protein [Puia sp.]
MGQIFTSGLLAIQSRKLLLAFSSNKKAWYLPGGKVDHGETSTQALVREIREELNINLNKDDLLFYTHITAPAFGEKKGIIMEQDCYLYDLTETPSPSSEIRQVRYFNCADYRCEPEQVPGVVMILHKLNRDGILD